MSRPFFTAGYRIGSAILYFVVVVPIMLVVLGVPVAALLSFPANRYGSANLAAVLAAAFLAAKMYRNSKG
jgi:hypothetical protein